MNVEEEFALIIVDPEIEEIQGKSREETIKELIQLNEEKRKQILANEKTLKELLLKDPEVDFALASIIEPSIIEKEILEDIKSFHYIFKTEIYKENNVIKKFQKIKKKIGLTQRLKDEFFFNELFRKELSIETVIDVLHINSIKNYLDNNCPGLIKPITLKQTKIFNKTFSKWIKINYPKILIQDQDLYGLCPHDICEILNPIDLLHLATGLFKEPLRIYNLSISLGFEISLIKFFLSISIQTITIKQILKGVWNKLLKKCLKRRLKNFLLLSITPVITEIISNNLILEGHHLLSVFNVALDLCNENELPEEIQHLICWCSFIFSGKNPKIPEKEFIRIFLFKNYVSKVYKNPLKFGFLKEKEEIPKNARITLNSLSLLFKKKNDFLIKNYKLLRFSNGEPEPLLGLYEFNNLIPYNPNPLDEIFYELKILKEHLIEKEWKFNNSGFKKKINNQEELSVWDGWVESWGLDTFQEENGKVYLNNKWENSFIILCGNYCAAFENPPKSRYSRPLVIVKIKNNPYPDIIDGIICNVINNIPFKFSPSMLDVISSISQRRGGRRT